MIRSRISGDLRSQGRQKRFPYALEFVFELLGAIAIAAGPRFGAVFMPAIPASMGVLHTEELKIFLPIGPLLGERWIAKTGFNPRCGPGRIDPGLLHIVPIFIAGMEPLPSLRSSIARRSDCFWPLFTRALTR